MAATATTTPSDPRQCTGAKLAGDQLTEPHTAPLSEFNRYSSSKDGYDKICRVCWATYERTRKARKAEAAGEPVPMPKRAYRVKGDGTLQPVAPAEPASGPATVSVSGLQEPPKYADPLAVKAARGKAPGYTTEEINGTIYALPEGPEAVASAEGQVALEACNQARAAERRRRDAERKREERARKKAEATGATQA
jgi:hypothetical protein